MAQESQIEVVNKFGWRKEFVLERPIVQIGRDGRNDIVLDDGHDNGIAARHAQLLPSAANAQGMRLVNLSGDDITVFAHNAADNSQGTTISARSSGEIVSGDRIKIGDFTLIYRGGEQRSAIVKLRLDVPNTVLALDGQITGELTIEHVGNKAAVQFKIELEGFDPDCYEIGPGPVLFPNAEKHVSFRLRHPKRPKPAAGPHTISFHVTAPDAYPGERASISKEIEIAPYYNHKMRLVVMDSVDFRLQ